MSTDGHSLEFCLHCYAKGFNRCECAVPAQPKPTAGDEAEDLDIVLKRLLTSKLSAWGEGNTAIDLIRNDPKSVDYVFATLRRMGIFNRQSSACKDLELLREASEALNSARGWVVTHAMQTYSKAAQRESLQIEELVARIEARIKEMK